MKVCGTCRNQCPDSYNACPNCGNPNLQYIPDQQQNMQQPMYGNGQPMMQPGMTQGMGVQQGMAQAGMSVDEQLLRVYVGNNYDKISTKGWNWSAALLSPAYIIYRKLYIIGLPLYAFNLVISRISYTLYYVILLAIFVGFGLKFNSFYIDYAKKQIEKIKSENPNADFNTLSSKVQSKGGTSLGLMILAIIVVAILCNFILSALGLGSMIEFNMN